MRVIKVMLTKVIKNIISLATFAFFISDGILTVNNWKINY